MDTELREQPTPDQRANDSDSDIGYEAEASPRYNLPCQPSRYETDQQDDEQTFARQIHTSSPLLTIAGPQAYLHRHNADRLNSFPEWNTALRAGAAKAIQKWLIAHNRCGYSRPGTARMVCLARPGADMERNK
jgi:hypothetical protein